MGRRCYLNLVYFKKCMWIFLGNARYSGTANKYSSFEVWARNFDYNH